LYFIRSQARCQESAWVNYLISVCSVPTYHPIYPSPCLLTDLHKMTTH
jgi:hypothetical protein